MNEPGSQVDLAAAGRAVGRFDPRPTRLRRLGARLVASLSRWIMLRGNRLEIHGGERLHRARATGRGLLTFSNHVSLFDDPLLTACLSEPDWESMRWVAADAMNFFGSSLRAMVFNAGKCVPVIRGAGLDQPGMEFLTERLLAGEWVHVFPEGGRTRSPEARLRLPFKPGFARLVKESRPLLLPYHHRGMHEILPIGAALPALGKTVTMTFGEIEDSAEDLAGRSLEAITLWAEGRLLALAREKARSRRMP